MTVLFCSVTGEAITLIKEINTSGEGTIWLTSKSDYIAKIYHSPDSERIKKLKVMLAYPPVEPNSKLNHISFAWPKSLLQDSNGRVLGFLMPYIADSQELISIYNPQRRLKLGLGVDWYFLHTVAHNIASIIHAIHSKGYVIGDIKPQNILVNNRALPSIIDTDSFQVRNPKNNKIYHCLVGSEGFTPAELLGQDLATVKQTEVHDRFRLGVIIYLLLLAEQPFKGVWTGKGTLPEPTELLRQGFWSHGQNSLVRPSSLTIPLNILHPELQRCFQLCFDDGHIVPHRRPTAADWKKALITARTQLINCNRIDNHIYNKSYGKCYWCERTANIQFDIFPGKTVASQPSQNQPKVFAATDTKELINQKSQEITVKGKVISVNLCNQHHHFILNFGKINQNTNNGFFQVIVSSSSVEEVSDALNVSIETIKDLVGKIIQVTGKIKIKSSKKRIYPQIVIDTAVIVSKNNQANIIPKPNQIISPQSIKTSSIYSRKARACIDANQYTQAIEFYKLAIQYNPNNHILYYNRGNIYCYLDDYQNAIQDYKQALQLNPNHANAANNLTVARNMLLSPRKTSKKVNNQKRKK